METILARLTTMRDELNALITEVSSTIRADPAAPAAAEPKKRAGRPKKVVEDAAPEPQGEKALTDMTGQELRDVWASLTGREKGIKSSGKFTTKALLIAEIQRLQSGGAAETESVASKKTETESKSEGKKSLSDMTEEEKKEFYKARAAKAAASRMAKKAESEASKVVAEVEAEAKELVAKHEEVKEEVKETSPEKPLSPPSASADGSAGGAKKRIARKPTSKPTESEEKRMCRVCVQNLNLGTDHRPCLVKAFDEGMFSSVAEWEEDTKVFGKTFA